jgi:hypothetical protein
MLQHVGGGYASPHCAVQNSFVKYWLRNDKNGRPIGLHLLWATMVYDQQRTTNTALSSTQGHSHHLHYINMGEDYAMIKQNHSYNYERTRHPQTSLDGKPSSQPAGQNSAPTSGVSSINSRTNNGCLANHALNHKIATRQLCCKIDRITLEVVTQSCGTLAMEALAIAKSQC